jgi:hypothetical protein
VGNRVFQRPVVVVAAGVSPVSLAVQQLRICRDQRPQGTAILVLDGSLQWTQRRTVTGGTGWT